MLKPRILPGFEAKSVLKYLCWGLQLILFYKEPFSQGKNASFTIPLLQAKVQLLQNLYCYSFFGAPSPCHTGGLLAQADEAKHVLAVKIFSPLANAEC